jgi:hypothetical protein
VQVQILRCFFFYKQVQVQVPLYKKQLQVQVMLCLYTTQKIACLC